MTMSYERTKVHLDLRKTVAEKLRAICHARGETASQVIDRWIIQANERGEIATASKPATVDDMLSDLISGVRRGR